MWGGGRIACAPVSEKFVTQIDRVMGIGFSKARRFF